ncbi:MAG TPA: cob(I)yrinic acid a,c-diamide adenosyltransferase [Acidimicrobiia bacterium]|nr:cob(I)yrinic acid a,c-diamide adenosyltransferase [Acidimicrobiia bacterium]
MARIDTKTGDDGTTGLFYGGRVSKADFRPRAFGAVDEAQAALGLVRALGGLGADEATLVTELESELYVAMAELATAASNRHKLVDGQTKLTAGMISRLENLIGTYSERFEMPTEFVIPGSHPASALLDSARTVVRRAEREVVAIPDYEGEAVRYLNRLSDLLWVLARALEGESLEARQFRQSLD